MSSYNFLIILVSVSLKIPRLTPTSSTSQHRLSIFSFNGDHNGRGAQKQNILEKTFSDGPSAIRKPLFHSNVTRDTHIARSCTENILLVVEVSGCLY